MFWRVCGYEMVTITADQINYFIHRSDSRRRVWAIGLSYLLCGVAKACAALDGRVTVTADDLRSAVELVIVPRSSAVPPTEDEQQPPPPPPPRHKISKKKTLTTALKMIRTMRTTATSQKNSR